jgi:SAM-dependent methyltransferase
MKKLFFKGMPQKDYYNNIARDYDLHYGNPHAISYRRDIYSDILKNVPLNGMRVLDAMCGGGQNTEALQDFNCEFVGIDVSEEQCKNYTKRFPDAEIHCRSIIDTGLPDAQFDIVITDSLHHLHPYVTDGIEELNRLLRPGGYLLIWEPSAGSLFNFARQLWYRVDSKYFQDNEAAIDIERLARKHGADFELIQAKYGGNLAYLLVNTSMALRIPAHLIKYYANLIMPIERFIAYFQTKLTSLWVLALFQKIK